MEPKRLLTPGSMEERRKRPHIFSATLRHFRTLEDESWKQTSSWSLVLKPGTHESYFNFDRFSNNKTECRYKIKVADSNLVLREFFFVFLVLDS